MGQSARDVMQPNVITLSADTPLIDVQRLFVEEEIHGAPVVDETGRLEGVVSTRDLLRAVDEERDTVASEARYFREDLAFSGPDWASGSPEDFQDRLAERRVSEVMTRGGVTVSPGASIAEVASTMRRYRIHRVLVTEGEVLKGIISSFDLVALLEKEPEAL